MTVKRITREREFFTAWITKYALTIGIEKCDVEDCFDIAPDLVAHGNQCFHGNDWHRSLDAAVERAKVMQATKLKSIDKQRARIAALTFGSAS